MREEELVETSVRNPVASEMVRGCRFILRKQNSISHDTQPFPFLSNTSRCMSEPQNVRYTVSVGETPPGHTRLPAGKPFASKEMVPKK
jgi:hypothetical protein